MARLRRFNGGMGILDIDHLMVSVADSQAAGEAFERLGFAVTPRSVLPGMSNRLVCFPAPRWRDGICNFIELMALEDAGKAPPPMPQLLANKGPVSMVLAIDEAREAHADLQAKGMQTSPALDLQRNWTLPSGETLGVRFSVVIPTPGQAPLYWNLCQYSTPQHYVRPEFTSHANGATAMSAVIAVASDPVKSAAHYRKFWNASIRDGAPLTVELGDVALRLYTPAQLAQAFPGIEAKEGLIGAVIAGAGQRRLETAAGCLLVFED